VHNVYSNQWFWRTQILWCQQWNGRSIIYDPTSVMPIFLFSSLELTYLNILTTKSCCRIRSSSLRWNGWKWHLENSVIDWRFHSVNVDGKCDKCDMLFCWIGFSCFDNLILMVGMYTFCLLQCSDTVGWQHRVHLAGNMPSTGISLD